MRLRVGSRTPACARDGLTAGQTRPAPGSATVISTRVVNPSDAARSGYGENINVPTIDIISTEINFIGNLVGSYNDLCDLMALAARGAVTLHTAKYRLDDFQSAIDDLDAGNVRGRAILIP